MEKKNINIGGVRICTILLLTVFTIGRKYGQEQKNAKELINSLEQQPCACCLNFENVSEVAKVIDDEKTELKIAKTDLEKANKDLVGEKNNLQGHNDQLLNQNKALEIRMNNLEEERNKINKLLEEKNSKCNEINKNLGELREEFTKINDENEKQGKRLTFVQNVYKKVKKEKDDLEDILKNTQTNVNIEECVKFYNSISAEKKAKISLFLNQNELEEKKYTFYIPFKFKDCGDHLKKDNIIKILNGKVGCYDDPQSLSQILRGLFERNAFEKFKKDKIIDVATLKEIYFYSKFSYKDGNILDEDNSCVMTEKENEDNIIVPANCFYSTSENNKNNPNEITCYLFLAKGIYFEYKKQSIQLDYSKLIELVEIDNYWEKKKNPQENNLFLLELDFKDPECIALLEFVGKGNYGVVKKGLTFENGKLVTKAIKFTCSNDLFENSKEENILKEIRAGKIVNEIGVGNKIAFVKDYMKIDWFIERYKYENKKISHLKQEYDTGVLTNAVYTVLLNNNLKTLPSGKENVGKDFKNNVFSMEGNIGKTLYIMLMDLVNGDDLFLNVGKEKIDINILGDMLFDVLNNLYINDVALKDIKPKNIILDKQTKEFSIIDVQTLGKVGSDLTDPCGTPELWPFFKTLNLNLENDKIKKENIDEKDKLYDMFCNSIDDNFVDIYAACMTMYFASFSTYTAAGLLTLLLKWIILEKEKKISIVEKIEFLKKYAEKYTSYITNIKNKEKIEKLTADEEFIKDFFENIDDKNLNDNQKKDLAKLLKQVIYHENESKIFYLLDKIREKIGKKDEIEDLLIDDLNNIITFYKQCVKNDFGNFAILDKDKCNYADVIKYVLCYGSCLNYNGENEEEMKVDNILPKLQLKKEIGFNDKEFFDNIDYVKSDVIEKLKKGFNQKFIIDLLGILPLVEYEKILNQGVSKNSVDYYFDKKKNFQDNKINGNKIDIEIKKKAFYLLRYLEINRLFHIPKNLLKINSLIDKNTDDKNGNNILLK